MNEICLKNKYFKTQFRQFKHFEKFNQICLKKILHFEKFLKKSKFLYMYINKINFKTFSKIQIDFMEFIYKINFRQF